MVLKDFTLEGWTTSLGAEAFSAWHIIAPYADHGTHEQFHYRWSLSGGSKPLLEPVFHANSYGYRPGRSAHDARRGARSQCWRHDWVLDLDIKGFFDNIDWDLLLKAVRKHTDCRWLVLYIERWLKADVLMPDGTLLARDKGTPQGGVISPVLANLFLHYAFDQWMVRHHPKVSFERYADDIICHCDSEAEAESLRTELEQRLGACRLELHPEKTRIVYCADANRRGGHDVRQFDFLGYTFKPRQAMNRRRQLFTSFSPSPKCPSTCRYHRLLHHRLLDRAAHSLT